MKELRYSNYYIAILSVKLQIFNYFFCSKEFFDQNICLITKIYQKISELLGQPVVIENKLGAGGNIGVEAVVKISVNGQLPLRCVRISFGSLSLGVNNGTGDVTQTCSTWEST
jgi:hypothetical protein